MAFPESDPGDDDSVACSGSGVSWWFTRVPPLWIAGLYRTPQGGGLRVVQRAIYAYDGPMYRYDELMYRYHGRSASTANRCTGTTGRLRVRRTDVPVRRLACQSDEPMYRYEGPSASTTRRCTVRRTDVP